MQGVSPEFRVAVTDSEWFDYFRLRPNLTEMNFWRPGVQNTQVTPGTFWVFLLKPNTIAGCAIVEVAYPLPLWLAWEAFGPTNGGDYREEFYDRIAHHRHGNSTTPDTVIGCVGLTSPVFFDDPFGFAPYQSTWTNRSQPTKKYNATTPEGRALWVEIQKRVVHSAAISFAPQGMGAGSQVPRVVQVRLGQGGFRTRVIDTYERRCAITGERSLPALEAAHIKPFSLVQQHEVSNGLLLRADIHKLFDGGYVSVTPDLKFKVSDELRDRYSNGRIYYELDNSALRMPQSQSDRPNPEYLDWHFSSVFRR